MDTVLAASVVRQCPDCEKSYTHRSSLSKHRAQKHPASNDGAVHCRTDGCSYRCHSRRGLRHHLTTAHNFQMTERQLKFDSHAGFLEWKQQYERDTQSAYGAHRGATSTVRGVKNQVYFCSRDGFFRPKGKGSRSLKAQGSCKIDAHCTAGITAYFQVDGTVSVTVVDEHYGHEKDLAHVRLSAEERVDVAQKLALGVSFDRILDDIRESSSTPLERQHIITRQDIRNIERSLGRP
eukprot:XP_794602.2 PREDICTED: uncharacterized protein LOC589879 [Strongylocentrotus purpuratus]